MPSFFKKSTRKSNRNKIDYHSFAINNDFTILLSKIKDDNSLINSIDNNQNTFLHYALINKNIEAIVHLLNTPEIDVNFKNSLGDIPLHIACYNVFHSLKNRDKNIYYHFEIIILLLNKGARKNLLNNESILPFDYLKNINTLSDQNGDTLLHIVLKDCKIHIARFMIEYLNFDLNTQNNKGETPVHFSVFNAIKHFDDMEFYYFLNFLFKIGYNEYIRDSHGFSAGNYLEYIFIK
jgi:ankyrin repeat protein